MSYWALSCSQTTLAEIDTGALVPLWLVASFPAFNLDRWLNTLLRRSQQLEHWLLQERPQAFWLAGFYHPQGFLTAVKQEVKRAHPSWPLDSMSLHTQVLRLDRTDMLTPPDDGGALIYGLFLEGAAWDRKQSKLRDPNPRTLLAEMPVMHVTAFHGTGTSLNSAIRDLTL